jgi:hypothetical protein
MSTLPEPLQHFKEDAEPLLTKLEEIRGTNVLPIFYSINRYVAKPDVDYIYEALLSIEDKSNIDVILFSHGGDPDQAYLIGSMLQEFTNKKLTVIVPRIAKSAATLIACAADELIMLPSSELGPIDPVIESPETKRYVPVLSLMESFEILVKKGLSEEVIKEVLHRIPVTELGDYNRLADHTKSLAERLLVRRMFRDEKDVAESIAEKLCKGYKSHYASITLSDVRELGLKLVDITKDVKDAIWNLHKLWIDKVIEYEDKFPENVKLNAINFKVGKGVVFCAQPSLEVVEKACIEGVPKD